MSTPKNRKCDPTVEIEHQHEPQLRFTVTLLRAERRGGIYAECHGIFTDFGAACEKAARVGELYGAAVVHKLPD